MTFLFFLFIVDDMKLDNLHDLFILEIQDLYDAENQITQAMPQLLEAVTSPDLKEAMQNHLDETRNQIKRLEDLCKERDIEPSGKTCVGMEGIIEEAVELLQETVPSPTLDAALLAAIQKVEHYEIEVYGTAAAYAKQLEYDSSLELLLETLREEKEEDENLSKLAEGTLNKKAHTFEATEGKYAM